MIEVMCRDGSVSIEDLESAADLIKIVLNQDVNILTEDEHRAMVFWGPADVKIAMERLGLTERELCEEEQEIVLAECEGEIHHKMLEAGWDVLCDEVANTVNSHGY